MTPNHIEILIHCHCFPEPHPRFDAPAVKSGLRDLISWGLVEGDSTTNSHTFITTARGKCLVEMLCNTPFPVKEEVYVDPRDGKVVERT